MKKCEEKFLALFEKSDKVLFKWNNDAQWSVAYVSSNVHRLLGYSQEDFLANTVTYTNIISSEDYDQVKEEVKIAIQEKKESFQHLPYKVILKNEQIKWIQDTTVIVYDDHNKIDYFLGYLSDITISMEYQQQLESEVESKTKSLNILNKKLQQRVDSEIKKNKMKDLLLLQNSKLAIMGEMLDNISHQWKQPLSSISYCASGMQLNQELGLLTEDILDNSIDSILVNTNFLAETIENFRSFLKPNHLKEEFSLKDTLEKTTILIEASLYQNQIKLFTQLVDFNLFGNKSELIHVILNLLQNAKDAIIQNKVKESDRFIKIDTIQEDDSIFINVSNNGGEIPKEIMEKIFNQYFTTKDLKGTGIGLHMSKKIIEEHFHGTLNVQNETLKYNNSSFKGVKFTVCIPNN